MLDLNNETDALRAGIQNIRDEAGGALRLYAVGPEHAAGLLADSLLGDVEAMRVMRGVLDTVQRIEAAPRRKPMLCACCPRALRGSGFIVCLMMPERDAPTTALGFGICERCGQDEAALPTKAADALKNIWPDLRPIAITHPTGGHA
jgi:hypothetical protein